MRSAAVGLLAVGCWGGSASPTLSNTTRTPALFTITAASFGPIDARSPASLTALRRLLPSYEVRPVNDGSLEYDVFLGAEELMFVVPNDDGTVFNVHATSPRIASDRGWRVGEPFHGAAHLTSCECWGDNPTCYHKGDHVAVNFKRACDDSDDARAALEGVPIQRVIWSPTPFGEPGTGGEGYGGDDVDPGD